MKHELRSLGVIRTANIVAVIYAAVMALFALIALPLIGIAIAIGATQGEGEAAISGAIMFFVIVLYPILGLIFGWLTGLVTALVYNLVAGWIGGLILDLRPEQ